MTMLGFILHTPDCTEIRHAIEVLNPSNLPEPPEGFMWTEVPTPAQQYTVALDLSGNVEVLPFEHESGIALELAKAAKIAAINARQKVAEAGGCNTANGRIQTDAESQRKVSGAALMGLLAQVNAQPFSVAWTMEDNTTVTHTGPQIMQAGVAVGLHIDACHTNARTMKNQVLGATTLAQVEAIDVEAGWPP